ncbi:RNA-binding S4 domain-containing protein [Mariniblastus fucicola]|uniref:Ribosome-associated protein n=1 Tax=Mariniblastus fucicola TaxID=980251 RepID=A0A5B9P8B8_9BACT|nr:RNA-binding S4 domain-containing protein [Mariniblastus fucicola]QEG21759.1 ribosome-associated protein [Mariniblastus fucicola]
MSEENQPAESPAEDVPLNIRLDQFLQLCGVPTGGQAKILIQDGQVTVNGEVETRRRKKLVIGDEVGLDGEVYDVALSADEEE